MTCDRCGQPALYGYRKCGACLYLSAMAGQSAPYSGSVSNQAATMCEATPDTIDAFKDDVTRTVERMDATKQIAVYRHLHMTNNDCRMDGIEERLARRLKDKFDVKR